MASSLWGGDIRLSRLYSRVMKKFFGASLALSLAIVVSGPSLVSASSYPPGGSTAPVTLPTVIPTTGNVVEVTDLVRRTTPGNSIVTTATAGQSVSAQIDVSQAFPGLQSNSIVYFGIQSTLRWIGEGRVNGSGLVITTLKIPQDLRGTHTLIAYSPDQSKFVKQPIVVSGPRLPATGGSSQAGEIGLILALVGGGLLTVASVARRRVRVGS